MKELTPQQLAIKLRLWFTQEQAEKINKALEIEDNIREWFIDYFNQSPLEECEITIRDKLQSILGEKK